MRKFFIAVLAGTLSLSLLTACSSKGKEASTTEKTTEKKTEKTTTAEATETLSEEDTIEYLKNEMSEAYAGVTEGGLAVFYAGNEDGSLGILLFADPDTKETASFVGAIKQVGEHRLTITDKSSQTTMTFDVSRLEDNTLLLDLGEDFGQAQIEECAVSVVIDAMKKIEENGVPVL